MKGLLHSKKFRKNLYKWLFMYVGVMALLTTVITYSKYVSSMMSSDSARVAKFDVNVSTKCDTSSGFCNIGEYRPTQNMEYGFTLNANIEVKTKIVLTIVLNERFNLVKIEELVDGKTVEQKNYTSGKKDIGVGGTTEHYNVYSLALGDFNSSFNKEYKVTVKFDNKYCPVGSSNCNEDETYYNMVTGESDYDIMRIDYSADQVKS